MSLYDLLFAVRSFNTAVLLSATLEFKSEHMLSLSMHL